VTLLSISHLGGSGQLDHSGKKGSCRVPPWLQGQGAWSHLPLVRGQQRGRHEVWVSLLSLMHTVQIPENLLDERLIGAFPMFLSREAADGWALNEACLALPSPAGGRGRGRWPSDLLAVIKDPARSQPISEDRQETWVSKGHCSSSPHPATAEGAGVPWGSLEATSVPPQSVTVALAPARRPTPTHSAQEETEAGRESMGRARN
jgi:hypothetical protein